MRRTFVLIALLWAGAAQAGDFMSNPLNMLYSDKSTRSPMPVGANTSNYMRAIDANAVKYALMDVRSAIWDLQRSGGPVVSTGSVTPRTLSDRFAEVANVKDFGAKGDGVSDDTVYIQNAINSLPVGGGVVWFPTGTYETTAPIIVPTFVSLIGAGVKATAIQKTNHNGGSLTSITQASGIVDNYIVDAVIIIRPPPGDVFARFVSIEDMFLEGTPTNGIAYGVYAPRANHLSMRRVTMQNWYIQSTAEITAPYVQPAIGGTVTVSVDRTSWMLPGEQILINGGGYYTIVSVVDANTFVAKNLGTQNTAPGNTVSSAGIILQGSGYFTYNTWMSHFDRVTVQEFPNGFNFQDDGGHSTTGTSCTFDSCYARTATQNGFNFYGLYYSTLNSCGVDYAGAAASSIASGVKAYAYNINYCDGMVLNGCGAEESQGTIIHIGGGNVAVNGFYAYSPYGATFAPTTGLVEVTNNAQVTAFASNFAPIVAGTVNGVSSPGNIYNTMVWAGGQLTFFNSIEPSGGATYSNYTSNASMESSTGIVHRYYGTSNTGTGQAITTWTSGATIAGYRQVKVNGTTYWEPFYTAPTGP